MIKINGREFKINMDMKWGTQKLLKKIHDDPTNIKNLEYMEMIIKDMLRPQPTNKEVFNFRSSDIEKIFNELNEETAKTSKDFKKKLSQ